MRHCDAEQMFLFLIPYLNHMVNVNIIAILPHITTIVCLGILTMESYIQVIGHIGLHDCNLHRYQHSKQIVIVVKSIHYR